MVPARFHAGQANEPGDVCPMEGVSMRRTSFSLLAVSLCCLTAGGCITPWNTRLPTVEPAPTTSEKFSFQRHDPFGDRDLGPEMWVRPRGYEAPRPEARRAAELKIFRGYNAPANPPPAQSGSTQPGYSQVVRD